MILDRFEKKYVVSECLLTLAFVLVFILIGFGLAFSVFGAEPDFKTITEHGITMTLPEKAPEFLNWRGEILGTQEYPNGNALRIVRVLNEDETVMVTFVLLRVGKNKEAKMFVILAGVSYAVPMDRGPQNRPEFLADKSFLVTGVPSGILEYVPGLPSWETIESKMGSRGNL